MKSLNNVYDLHCRNWRKSSIQPNQLSVSCAWTNFLVTNQNRSTCQYFSHYFMEEYQYQGKIFWLKKVLTRFFFPSGGYSIASYVLLTELVGIRHRSTAGCSIWYSFNLSNMALAGLAYLVRDWRKLSLIMGAPAIPFLLGWL